MRRAALIALVAASVLTASAQVVAGGQFRAGATGDTGLERGETARLASAAYAAHHDESLAATLTDFVDRVGAARKSGGSGSGGGGGGFPWWIAIVAIAVGFFVF